MIRWKERVWPIIFRKNLRLDGILVMVCQRKRINRMRSRRKEVKKFEGSKVDEEEEADKYKMYRAIQRAGVPRRR